MTGTSRLSASGYALLWTGLWLAIMASAVKFRPFLPVDETRYLAVAWEMWRDGNFLVPHLNGEPYSHKPPLLFWLMHAGWAVFGVNEWWPRLVAPLFGLASLFLTSSLARRLWPSRPAVALAAPLILFACLFWTLFT
ncbi:MAG: glycosyltransferase family 39 protein, partial [Rhodospirillales bacterium]|nr:glycosyltransferase family 39 protein [Rhodospirillales bacterium]